MEKETIDITPNFPFCPRCYSTNTKKNGLVFSNKSSSQRYKCKSCRKTFIPDSQDYFISDRDREIIKNLLLERLSLAGICRAVGVSKTWLLAYIKKIYSSLPEGTCFKWLVKSEQSENQEFIINKIENEADELWSFVGSKENPKYVWIVMHRSSRQIIAFEVGDRSRATAKRLWEKIPEEIKQKGIFYTDDWDAYKTVIPEKKHLFHKHKQHTNHIERFNCTIRQRVSRLVRKALSFSKSLDNHLGAIKYFIQNYNLEIQKSFSAP